MVKIETHCKVTIFAMLLLLVSMPSSLHGQSSRFQFRGKVLDRKTFTPVAGVNITVAGSRRGCSSNQNGEFMMNIYTRPVFLNVSHLNYEPQKIWLDSTSNTITILLNPASRLLQEVEIRAKSEPEPFFRDNKYSVLDYEIDDSLVFLLVYRFRINYSEILCKSVTGDTIARSGTFPFKPKGLFLDCMNNLHLLTEDSVYQIYLNKEKLSIAYVKDIKLFRLFLADCVAATDTLLFFRKESPDHLSVEFSMVNRRTSQRQTLSSVGDEQKLKMLRRNPQDFKYLAMDTPPRSYDDVITWLWLKKIVYKTNASSLHKIDDILCIFNTADYTLELFTLRGEFTSKLKMPVPDIHEGRWTSEIHIDNVDHKAYTSFLTKGGNFTLFRINLNTGELKKMLSAVHDFPQKPRICKGFLYYLYDFPGEGDNRRLFRQKL
ncbi:MAG: carboxypeptidase-like regulatory domain-containing protein [bacterium]